MAREIGGVDYIKLSKAMQRQGNALVQLQRFDEALEILNKALIENNDHGIKMSIQNAQKAKKKCEDAAFVNPELAEEHRVKGNEFFKANEYPAAIKEYELGLRRNPKSVAILSNRCAAYIKLMDIPTALKDADQCLELDPTFIKAFARKGTCHHMMKEYHKALKSFEDGLKLDPTNKECLQGKQKTMTTI